MEQQLVAEFFKLGCKTQRNAVVTFQVYMELNEVKRLHDVQYHYSENLERMYLTAKNAKSDLASVYIPMVSSENISFDMMEKMLLTDSSEPKNIYLVLLSADSTSVYYQLSEGLPSTPDLHNKETIAAKRHKRDSTLNNRRDEILQAAYLKTNVSSLRTNTSESPSQATTSK